MSKYKIFPHPRIILSFIAHSLNCSTPSLGKNSTLLPPPRHTYIKSHRITLNFPYFSMPNQLQYQSSGVFPRIADNNNNNLTRLVNSVARQIIFSQKCSNSRASNIVLRK